MAQIKCGSFAAITSGGPTQSVTGLPFAPKAVRIIATRATAVGATGSGATFGDSYGLGTGSANRGCMSITQVDNANTGAHGWSESSIIQILNSDGTVYAKADLVSLDSGGFTITWSTLPAAAITIMFQAIGGADITNAKVGFFATPSSGATGNVATTGIGFKPDILEFFGATLTSETTATFTTSIPQHARGAATSAAQYAVISSTVDAANCLYTSSAKIANWVSMDTDGFTLHWHPAPAAADRVGYLALKGGTYFVGTDTEATTNTTKATTGVGFPPAGIFVNGTGGQVSVAYEQDVGAADSTTSRWSQSMVIRSINPSRGNSDYETTALLKYISDTTGTATAKGTADLSSFDNNGQTFSWASTDGTARTFGFIAYAPSLTAVGASVSMPATVKALAGKSLSQLWTVKVLAGQSCSHLWSVIAHLGKSLVQPWSIIAHLGVSLVQPSSVDQVARPLTDITRGGWDTAPVASQALRSQIDEAVDSGTDYIFSSQSPGSADVCEVLLSAVADPASSTGHVVEFGYQKDQAAGDSITLTVRLMQGATQIVAQTFSNITSAHTVGRIVLTGAQADAITDYANLRLRFEAVSP